MPTCPECGLPDQEGSCAHCGTVLDDDAGHTGGEPREEPGSQADTAGVNHQTESGESSQESDGEEEPAPTEDGPSADEPTVSRRKLLAGGVGATAVATGGWYFFLRGPTGAKAVAQSYVQSIKDNDWAAAESLLHERSPAMTAIESSNTTDSYEGYLERESRLARLEDVDPSIKEIIEWRHVPDFTEEAAESLIYGMEPGAADQVAEAKELSVIVDVSIDSLTDVTGGRGDRTEHLAGDTTTSSISVTAVKSQGDWSLWQTRGPY